MRRLFPLLALVALAPLAHAQDYPAAGTGAFTWTTLGDPVQGTEIIFPDDGTPTAFNGNQVYRYDATSDTWAEEEFPNFVGSIDSALPLRGDTLIVGPRVARSVDGGATWEFPCGEGGPSTCDRHFQDNSENIAEVRLGPYAGRLLAGGALYSDDRGASWSTATVIANETNWEFNMRAFAPLPSGRVVGAGDWGIGISEDGGESWTPTEVFGPYATRATGAQPWATPGSVQAHDAGGAMPSCGLPDPELCEGAVVIGTGGAPHVRTWWTNDGGRSWNAGGLMPQVYDTPGWSKVALFRELDRAGSSEGAGLGRGIAILAAGFVYRTVDGGVTWDIVARAPSMGAEPEDGGIIYSAEIGPDGRIYTVQAQIRENVWVTNEVASSMLSYVVADEASPEPGAVGVSVRPNPSANGAVTVEVSVAEAVEVRAVVVDALGRTVAEVLAGAVRGTRTVEVDTSGWAAGVYAVVVEAGGARVVEVVTVVR